MAIAGFFYTLLMFAVCFALVHLVKLARLGLDSLKEREKPQPQPTQKPAEKAKPVYYIVEKKSTRRSYGTPREIKFTDRDK